MKAALIQLDIAWQDRRRNYEKAAFFAGRAAADKCDLIVFPEMFNTGFSMDLAAVADEGIGETTSILSNIAKTNNINLIAGFPMKSPAEEKGRNIAVVYDRTGMLSATYTKMHPFCLAEEGKYYMTGESVTIFNIDGMPSSVFICYDLRFPEVFRKIANQVKAIFVISNWPASRGDHWDDPSQGPRHREPMFCVRSQQDRDGWKRNRLFGSITSGRSVGTSHLPGERYRRIRRL